MAKIPQYFSQQEITPQSAIPDMPNIPTIGEGLERAGNIVAGTMLENQSREHALWVSRSRQQLQTQLWKLGESYQERINKGEFTDEKSFEEAFQKEAQRLTDKADPKLMKYIKADLDQTSAVNMAEGRKFVRAYRSEQQKQVILDGVGNALKSSIDPTTSEEKRNLLIEQTRKSIFDTPDVSIEWKNKTFNAFKDEIYGFLFDNALANNDFQSAEKYAGYLSGGSAANAQTILTKAKINFQHVQLSDDYLLKTMALEEKNDLNGIDSLISDIKSKREQLGGQFDNVLQRAVYYRSRIESNIEHEQDRIRIESNLRSQSARDKTMLNWAEEQSKNPDFVPDIESIKSNPAYNDQDKAYLLNYGMNIGEAEARELEQETQEAYRKFEIGLRVDTISKLEQSQNPQQTLIEIEDDMERLFQENPSDEMAITAYENIVFARTKMAPEIEKQKKYAELSATLNAPAGSVSPPDMDKALKELIALNPETATDVPGMLNLIRQRGRVPEQFALLINSMGIPANPKTTNLEDESNMANAGKIYTEIFRTNPNAGFPFEVGKAYPGLENARAMYLMMNRGETAKSAYQKIRTKYDMTPEAQAAWREASYSTDFEDLVALKAKEMGLNIETARYFLETARPYVASGDDYDIAIKQAAQVYGQNGGGISYVSGVEQSSWFTPEKAYPNIPVEELRADLFRMISKKKGADGKPLDLSQVAGWSFIGNLKPYAEMTGGEIVTAIKVSPSPWIRQDDPEHQYWNVSVMTNKSGLIPIGAWNDYSESHKKDIETKAAQSKAKMEDIAARIRGNVMPSFGYPAIIQPPGR